MALAGTREKMAKKSVFVEKTLYFSIKETHIGKNAKMFGNFPLNGVVI